jgi:hypothetical protein
MKSLSQKGSINYDELLFSAFGGDNEALKCLIRERILSVKSNDGTYYVSAFSPLYQAAFVSMVNSPTFRKGMDIIEKKADIKKDMETLSQIEQELMHLMKGESSRDYMAALSLRRKALNDRMTYIAQKLETKEKELKALETGGNPAQQN